MFSTKNSIDMQTSTPKRLASLALGLIIVGGGGLIFAHDAFKRDITAMAATKSLKAGNKNLKDLYAGMAAKALASIKSPASPALAPEDPAADVILEEDFSLFSEGSEEELGSYVSTYFDNGDSSIDSSLTQTPGWWGFGVMQAGGAAALAEPGFGGVLTTGPMNMYGNIHVSFRIKAREGNPVGEPVSMIVNALCGDAFNPTLIGGYQTISTMPGEGWKEFTLNFQIPNKTDDVRIQFNAAMYLKAGLLLDDVKITRDFDFCLQPLNLSAYGFDYEGFTAEWEPNAENNSFLFTLREVKEISDKDVDDLETFEDITPGNLPEGWEASLGETVTISENEGYEGSKGLVIDGADYLTVSGGGGRIYDFKCFVNSKVNKDADEPAYMVVEGFCDDVYNKLASIRLQNISEDGYTLDLGASIQDFAYKYTKIRFSAESFGEGDYCIIDNVEYSASPATAERIVMEDMPVATNSYRIDGLDPAAEYYYAVEGVKNETFKSGRTPFFHALGLPAPVATNPSDISKRGAYTAGWEETPKAVVYEVANYKHRVMAEDRPAYTLIKDEFENAREDEGYLEGTSFDGIADNKGWQTVDGFGLVNVGMIGSFMKPLLTPELSLANNDGKFTVKMKFQAFPDEIVVVQSMTEYRTIDMLQFFPDADPYAGMVDYEATFTFSDGVDHERLMIYGAAYGTVLIDSFEVTQDLKAGDAVNTYEGMAQVTADNLSHRFTGLTNTPDFSYTYNMLAYGNYYGTIFNSMKSKDVAVDLNSTRIEEVIDRTSASRGIAGLKGAVEVTLSDNADISVYSLTGTVVATTEGTPGVNRVEISQPGIYVVTVGKTATKVVVK